MRERANKILGFFGLIIIEPFWVVEYSIKYSDRSRICSQTGKEALISPIDRKSLAVEEVERILNYNAIGDSKGEARYILYVAPWYTRIRKIKG